VTTSDFENELNILGWPEEIKKTLLNFSLGKLSEKEANAGIQDWVDSPEIAEEEVNVVDAWWVRAIDRRKAILDAEEHKNRDLDEGTRAKSVEEDTTDENANRKEDARNHVSRSQRN